MLFFGLHVASSTELEATAVELLLFGEADLVHRPCVGCQKPVLLGAPYFIP